MTEPVAIPFVADIPDDEAELWFAALDKALSPFIVKPLAALSDDERADARVAIIANPQPEALAALPNLVFAQSLWAGVDRLIDGLPDAHFGIVRLIDPQLAETMAEAALTAALYLHRDLPRYRQQQEARLWRAYRVRRPGERTIGVLGLGRLGMAAALRLQENGFNVLGWCRSPREPDGITCRFGPDGLDEVLAAADILLVLLPLTDATRSLLNARSLARLKPGAAIVNFARGAIIDEVALLARLDAGALSHAVLDVFATEPLPADSPFWQHPRVTVLPHTAAPTDYDTAAAIAAANVKRFMDTGEVPETVDRKKGY